MKYAGVALCGKTKSGKDSVFAALQTFDSRFVRLSFADELKSDLTRATGLNMHDASVREEYRWLLKDYGTLMRKFDQDIWVKRAMSRMPLFHLNLPVVTDVRYENEARITKENGFLLVRLDVEPETIVARGGSVSDHASETELDSYPDFVLRYQSEMFTPEEIARLIIDEIDRS